MKRETPVFRFMNLLYQHGLGSPTHSWRKLNGAMHKGMSAAIEAGMPFAENDVTTIASKMNGRYWLHVDGLYALAVEWDNVSACKAFEQNRGFKPYELDGRRIFVGRDFVWKGTRVTCTSISAKDMVACSYKGNPSDYPRKIDRRFALTNEDIVTEERSRTKATTDLKLLAAQGKALAYVKERCFSESFLGQKARAVLTKLPKSYRAEGLEKLIDRRFGKRGTPTLLELLAMGFRYQGDLYQIQAFISDAGQIYKANLDK